MSYLKRLGNYIDERITPRQRMELEDLADEGGFGIGGMRFGRKGEVVQANNERQQRNANKAENNQKVNLRESRLGTDATNVQQFLADRRIDAEQAAPYALAAGALAGGTALTGSARQAFNDQQSAYQPTDFLSVAGRMVNNANGVGAVGVDSLAEARNKVADARRIVGTEAMLEALAVDEIAQLRSENKAASKPMELQAELAVQAMIDERAELLMSQPIQKSDGSVAPMPYDTAQRLATEQVHMQLRAEGAY